METATFFANLDKEFIDLDRVVDETFFYKGADVLVQSTWELPIIIQWPGSTIKFEFSTARGIFHPLLHLNTLVSRWNGFTYVDSIPLSLSLSLNYYSVPSPLKMLIYSSKIISDSNRSS